MHTDPYLISADYFSAGAREYARFRPTYPGELFDWVAGLCSERDWAWDCACGSGQATTELAARFALVTGTDANRAQIANAPSLPNIDWHPAPAEDSGIPAGAIDLVTVAQALHWFDTAKFWRECQRVLKPNGIVAAWGYGTARLEHAAADRIFQDYHYGTLGSFWPKERQLVEERYASIDFPFEEIPAPDFTITAEWDASRIAGYCASWSATDCYRKAKNTDPIPSLAKHLTTELGEKTIPIRWPIFLRAGRLKATENAA
jgi:SAM-dependent methyltransferase